LTFTLIRAFYQRKAQRNRGKVDFRESKLVLLARLGLGIPFMLVFFAYMFRPSLLAWAALPLPVWMRWSGVILGLTSLPLILWVQRALDANFSITLHVRDEHTLVTAGPYRWVRHPMYSVLYIHWIGIALITATG
jgi:protein-S-isoprenylcysteine O-methyltransferase Ste14